MADYAITGKKGAGKSLFSIGLIRDALRSGKRVATNLDVHLDNLLSPTSKANYLRLPDRPCIDDFHALGRGQSGVIEDDNGLIILDETSTFFGARQYQDKGRQSMLDWLIHSRKMGWDVYYIMQGLTQVDKQIRDTQIEYSISVKRTDKWPIPLITPLVKLIGITLRFPKMHIGTIKHGTDRDALVIERKYFRAVELYSCYDTQQVFLDREHPMAVGLHSKLSAFHLKGRYLGWWAMNKHILYGGLMMGAVVGFTLGAYLGYDFGKEKTITATVNIPHDDSIRPVGVLSLETGNVAIMPDGKYLPVTGRKNENSMEYLLIDNKWMKP